VLAYSPCRAACRQRLIVSFDRGFWTFCCTERYAHVRFNCIFICPFCKHICSLWTVVKCI